LARVDKVPHHVHLGIENFSGRKRKGEKGSTTTGDWKQVKLSADSMRESLQGEKRAINLEGTKNMRKKVATSNHCAEETG